MANLFRRLVGVLASSTRHELRQQVQFLKAENEILRSKIAGPVRVNDLERSRLVALGWRLGPAIEQLLTIVKPETFAR